VDRERLQPARCASLPADASPDRRRSAGYPPHHNEIAIVHTPRGPYAVVLSMKGGTDSKMTKTMEWSSCVLYHALAKDTADPLTACTGP
jgi:hypothetical protein